MSVCNLLVLFIYLFYRVVAFVAGLKKCGLVIELMLILILNVFNWAFVFKRASIFFFSLFFSFVNIWV